MERSCDHCGRPYIAKRASSKYDSDLCRKRAQRSGAAAPRTPASSEAREAVDERIDEAATRLVTPAVLAELKEANAQDTAAGRVALALSLRLDLPSLDTGSAVASVARQLLEAMKAATADAKPTGEPDPLAEMRKAREERARRAGA
jgi:hypothetical protein